MERRVSNAAAGHWPRFGRCLRVALLLLLSSPLAGCFVVERPILTVGPLVPPDLPGNYKVFEVRSGGEVPSGHGRLSVEEVGQLRWKGISREGRQIDWRFVVHEVAEGAYLLQSTDMMEKPVLLLARRVSHGLDLVLPAMDDDELERQVQAHGIVYRRGVGAIGFGGIGLDGEAARIVGFLGEVMKGETKPLVRLVHSDSSPAVEAREMDLLEWRRLVRAMGKAFPVTDGFSAPRLDDGPDLLWWLKVEDPLPPQWDGVEVPVEVAGHPVGSVYVFFARPGSFPYLDFDKVTGLRYEPTVLADVAASFVATGLGSSRQDKGCSTSFTVAVPISFGVANDRFRRVKERLIPREEGEALAQRAFFWRTVDASFHVARLSIESDRRGLTGGHYRLAVLMDAAIVDRLCRSGK